MTRQMEIPSIPSYHHAWTKPPQKTLFLIGKTEGLNKTNTHREIKEKATQAKID